MHPAGGGYLPPGHVVDGYRLGLTPKCLEQNLAIGQSPTDSNSTGQQSRPGVWALPPSPGVLRLGSGFHSSRLPIPPSWAPSHTDNERIIERKRSKYGTKSVLPHSKSNELRSLNQMNNSTVPHQRVPTIKQYTAELCFRRGICGC